MDASPLRISEPLYSWDPIDGGDSAVCFDELHQRVIHQQRGGFSTVDIVDEGSTPDGLFVKFEEEGLRSARFSPDGLYFAFLCGKRRMGCLETMHPARERVPLTSKWHRLDHEVLTFFWLPPLPQQTDHADLVVVTTQGVEVFRLAFEARSARSLKSMPNSVRLCWVEPLAGMVLACTGQRTLQPFDLRAKKTTLPRFDLVLERDQSIEPSDVAIVTMYESTYCIHVDSRNSRVSLRNISNPQFGKPQHDIVIDVADHESCRGTLRLSKVDNLLIINCVETMCSMVFDIRHREGPLVARVCGPFPVAGGPRAAARENSCSWSAWEYLGGATILDARGGRVYRLQIDMGAVLREFLARQPPHDLATVMRFLQRRSNCREHIVHTLRKALSARTSSNEWAQGFAVLNHAYRMAIEALSKQASGVQARQQATISLSELEAVISQQSILSEKDMVAQVFYRHFMEARGTELGSAEGEAASTEGSPSAALDAWRIPLPPAAPATEGAGSKRSLCSPYLLSVVIAYLRSLLGMQILPHKILQCFVFDVCMHFQQEHTLQQLLHYHVLLDSPELVFRLKEVAEKRGSPWATQACLDMALRLHEFSVVADLLLHTKQYLDIVPFLVNQHEPSFKLVRLLEQIDADEGAREEDPDLLEHILSDIRLWRKEAADAEGVMPPDVEGLERWMPELRQAGGA